MIIKHKTNTEDKKIDTSINYKKLNTITKNDTENKKHCCKCCCICC